MDHPIAVVAPLPESPEASNAAMRRNRGTERARECRRRKKDGLKLIPIEIFEREINDLVRLGQLPADEQTDKAAISYALYPVIEAGFAAIKKAKGQ